MPTTHAAPLHMAALMPALCLHSPQAVRMTTAVEERPSHPLPHAAAGPKELPPFSFPAAPSTDTASPQQTPTQASFDSASIQRHAPTQAALEGHDASAKPAAPSPTAAAAAPRGHRHTSSLDSIDVTMGDDDDDQDSDNESVGSDSRPNKKKKSQRFYCTNYPPCNLSFTRSEHLARHIRKHTGERPFQCHCLRRFSRLDNLRQHAQTVHVNEDIPGDSLAATGTRFQRQIRTERMRPTAHRARASTLSTPGAHSRGHSRNMSSSSIGSIPDMGSPDDGRRRPQPLAMAHSPRHSLVVDTYAANSGSTESGQYQQPYYGYSPSGYSTPMSVFSHEASSPVGSTLQSPISFAPARSQAWEGRSIGHARRLSVPSQPTPTFHHIGPAPAYAAGPPQSAGAPPFSPTGSTFSGHAEAGQETRSPENYLKRRTWHPSTYSAARPATSGLSYYQTPDTPQPVAATQPAAQQSIQLPGISSFFDRAQGQPAPPPRRRPSSHMMDIDEPPRQGSSDHATSAGGSEAGSKRNSWASVNQHFTQMEIAQTPPSSAHRPVTAPFGSTGQTAAGPQPPAHLPVQEPAPAVEPPSTPRRLKRQAWIGPSPSSAHDSAITPSGLRTSPEGSSSTSSVEALRTPITGSSAEYHPAIVHNHGYGEVHAHHHVVDDPAKAAGPPAPHYHTVPAPSHYEAPGPGKPMDRLDALVAVATQADESMRR